MCGDVKMYEINQDVVFVKGTLKGAIYNFNDGKVYWINGDGCEIIEKYINSRDNITNSAELKYISELASMELLDTTFYIKNYKPEKSIPALEMAWLEITQGCNLKCLHCYEGNLHYSSNKGLKLKEWLNIIDELSSLRVKRVVVIGGEPCISPFLPYILKKLCDCNIPTTLFTNATLLSDELMDLIISNSNIIRVKVSIYGHNSVVHDRITTVKGSFNKMLRNIEYLTSHGVIVNAAVVIMKENQDYIQDIIGYVKQSEMIYTRYDVIRNVFGGTQNEHIPTNVSLINSVCQTKPNFSITKERFDNNAFYNSCWKGRIAITEDGNVLPCVFEREIICGNISNLPLSEIISSNEMQLCWCKSFDTIEYCKACEFRYACKDCRPLGKGVSGNISEKNPRCTYNPYIGEWNI